ncbi:MAG: hypothetical protein HFH67_16080 [Lachnospiraceae bacterium]|nr:hypothetical protein [Lachnospiraceae bacterium]
MRRMLLAVLADGMYSSRFSDYISHHKNVLIDLITFTSINSAEEYVKHSRIDILLVSGSMACEAGELGNIKKIIVLSDGSYTGHSEYPVIFKYQPAAHILKEIFAQVAEDDNIPGMPIIHTSKHAELIAVYSPYGGSGISTYARNLCAGMAGSNNVLYVNLEIFDSFAEFEGNRDNNEYICGMSEAVYYIKQKKDKLAFKLGSIIKHHKEGYNYILPVGDYRDLYSILPEDMECFTDVLGSGMMYDKVVFDVGYIHGSSLKLLQVCDVVIMPEASGQIQENKQHSFERLLIRNGMDKVIQNIQYVPMKGRWAGN